MSQQILFPEIIIREEIEWCRSWVPDSNVVELDRPRILLIGDSIVMGYGPKVAELIGEAASIAWVGTSRFPADPAFLDEIKLVLKYTQFDAIHFNNGMHGFDYSEEDYARHLKRAVSELMSLTKGMTWMLSNSTPVREPHKLDQFRDRNERVKVRNEAMRQLAEALSVPLTDLYSPLESHPEYHSIDGTHFNEDGQKVQGAIVADSIRRHVNGLPAAESKTCEPLN